MKIIHIIAYYNSIWDYQENHLAQQQALLGHEVHIIASNLNFPYTDYNNSAAKVLGPRKKPYGSFKNKNYMIHYMPIHLEFNGRVIFKNLKQKIKLLSPDLIIVHGITQPATIQLSFSKDISCSKIVDEHILMSDLVSKKKQYLLKLYGILFSKKIENSFAKIVSIAESSTDVLTKLIHISKNKVQLIPLGTDTSFYQPNEALGRKFRTDNKISHESVVVGYTGKIEKVKQLEVLIDACSEIKLQNLHLLLVGNIEKSYQSIIDEKLKELKITYTLLPFQPKEILPSLYNACSIMAWPAHQSISMMDVAACGKPFICPNYLKERLRRNQALGIDNGNKSQLKDALIKLILDRVLREEMGNNGRNWALEELSWKIINKKFINLN